MNTTVSPVIETSALVKTFGSTRALDGLDLSVAPGEVHGFLGPNGAGKSTTIRVLLGLLRADGGTARLFDADPWDDAVALHHRLAYVPGDVELWPNLTGGEAIDLFARLRGTLDKARRSELCERAKERKHSTISKSRRHRQLKTAWSPGPAAPAPSRAPRSSSATRTERSSAGALRSAEP